MFTVKYELLATYMCYLYFLLGSTCYAQQDELNDSSLLKKQLGLVLKIVAELEQSSGKLEANFSDMLNHTIATKEHVPASPMLVLYHSCKEIYAAGGTESGVYQISFFHGMHSIAIHCDMETVGVYSNDRGWMTIQRRQSGQVNFHRNWEDYVSGFGFPDEEHWIGLQNIYDLLRQGLVDRLDEPGLKLRIEAVDWDGNSAFVEYDNFDLHNIELDFKISTLGKYRGTKELGSPMRYGLWRRFSTKDHSNEPTKPKTCQMTGGWWFGKCRHLNLNGRYATGDQTMTMETIYLASWEQINPKNTALRYVSMKLQ